FFSSRRRHTRCYRDWSSDVCSSDLAITARGQGVFRDVVPSGMRHRQPRRQAGRHVVIRDARALEDAEALVAERTPADAIEVEKRSEERRVGKGGRCGGGGDESREER